jgi:hypothetical protein
LGFEFSSFFLGKEFGAMAQDRAFQHPNTQALVYAGFFLEVTVRIDSLLAKRPACALKLLNREAFDLHWKYRARSGKIFLRTWVRQDFSGVPHAIAS